MASNGAMAGEMRAATLFTSGRWAILATDRGLKVTGAEPVLPTDSVRSEGLVLVMNVGYDGLRAPAGLDRRHGHPADQADEQDDAQVPAPPPGERGPDPVPGDTEDLAHGTEGTFQSSSGGGQEKSAPPGGDRRGG